MIYFIKSPAANAVKIGFTKRNPEGRLKACQTGNADNLEMLGWCDGDPQLERDFHDVFQDFRIRGEWFRLEGKMDDFIRAFLDHYWFPRQGKPQ